MKKYPAEIESGKGLVNDESRFYKGFAVTLKTIYGEVILTAPNYDALKIQANMLMPSGFVVDEKMIQDVSIFSSKKVKKAN